MRLEEILSPVVSQVTQYRANVIDIVLSVIVLNEKVRPCSL